MNDLKVVPIENGVSFAIKAAPGSKSDQIRGIHDNMLKVAVTAAPEKGKANKAIVELLAKRLGVRKSDVTIESGAANSVKTIFVRGITVSALYFALGQS